MRINYNISANIANNKLNFNNDRLANSTQRLSSGLKINSAADDAAGLSIAKKMNAQIKSLQQANNNAEDGISALNTADGAMSEIHDILQRMNELCIQSANGTNASSDREYIQTEVNELIEEIDRIANTTQFNAQNLLDGTFALKGYTNSENIKTFAYSDYVNTGVYTIGSVSYSYYVNNVIDKNGKVDKEEKCKIDNVDAVKAALGPEFPNGAKVTSEDNIITISGNDYFEIQLEVNQREAVTTTDTNADMADTTSVTKYYITKQYNNVAIIDEATNSRFNLDALYMKKDSDADFTDDSTTMGTVNQDNFIPLSDSLIEQGAIKPYQRITDITYDNSNIEKPQITLELSDGTNTETKTFNLDYSLKEKLAAYGNYDKDKVTNYTRNAADDGYDVFINGSATKTYSVPDTALDEPMNDYLYETVQTKEKNITVEDITVDITNMGGMRLQVGANEGQVIEVIIPSLNTNYLGVDDLDVTDEENATEGIDKVSAAINRVSSIRAKVGAYTNRLEHTVTNLDTSEENMTSAYSRIMDVDMAEEMTTYSTYQVLVESSTSMLSHANEAPQSVLRLLQ